MTTVNKPRITPEEWELAVNEARDFSPDWYGHTNKEGGYDL